MFIMVLQTMVTIMKGRNGSVNYNNEAMRRGNTRCKNSWGKIFRLHSSLSPTSKFQTPILQPTFESVVSYELKPLLHKSVHLSKVLYSTEGCIVFPVRTERLTLSTK